jgi:hypothetical protein
VAWYWWWTAAVTPELMLSSQEGNIFDLRSLRATWWDSRKAITQRTWTGSAPIMPYVPHHGLLNPRYQSPHLLLQWKPFWLWIWKSKEELNEKVSEEEWQRQEERTKALNQRLRVEDMKHHHQDEFSETTPYAARQKNAWGMYHWYSLSTRIPLRRPVQRCNGYYGDGSLSIPPPGWCTEMPQGREQFKGLEDDTEETRKKHEDNISKAFTPAMFPAFNCDAWGPHQGHTVPDQRAPSARDVRKLEEEENQTPVTPDPRVQPQDGDPSFKPLTMDPSKTYFLEG